MVGPEAGAPLPEASSGLCSRFPSVELTRVDQGQRSYRFHDLLDSLRTCGHSTESQ